LKGTDGNEEIHMKALVYKNGALSYTADYPLPEPEPDESLIRVELAAVCNTDREILRGYKPDFEGVPGHEFVGVVERSNEPLLVGRRVVGELNAGCKKCLYCTTGREHHCAKRRVIGMAGKDGCFAQYLAIRTELLHLVPQGLPPEQAIYCEPLAAALEVPEQIHLRPSQAVAVVGDGRLAFLVAQVLALNGTPVTVFGHHEEKLAMFRSFADTRTQPGGSFEVVVEASGSPGGLDDAIRLVRSRGTLVLKSTYAKNVELNISEVVVRELTLCGSRCGPFVPALNLLGRGRLVLPDIEQHRLEDFEQAFDSNAFKTGFDLKE